MKIACRHWAILVLAVLAAAQARASGSEDAPGWAAYLRRDAVEDIQISPGGDFLAIADRTGDGTVVTIRERRQTLSALTVINPGDRGEVTELRWLDDTRVLVGANRADSRYNVPLIEPALYIVSSDGRDRYKLPANFVATIDGDPDHLLVSTCRWDDGCVARVHRVEIGHTRRLGDPIVTAPESNARLWTDRDGNVRFALAWDDESNGKLWVHRDGTEPWILVNDGKVSGTDATPLGLDHDGLSAFLASERKSGPDAIERYDIATGARTEIYRDDTSDPLVTIRAFDGDAPVGAYYDPTSPRVVIWNQAHPDVPALLQIFSAFPGKLVSVVSASADRNLAIVKVASDADPGSFYLFDRAERKAALLAHGRPWLESMPQPATRAVSFTSRDGLKLHGLLTTPPGHPGTALPMVVVPHGGPHGFMDAWGFDEESSLLASQGYVVLRINFRGSGGYGREFMERGYMEWGRAMQDDVTDATRWAIAQGIADPARICIHGTSYGGYAALMGAVREPGLYRCASSFAAPADLAKMYAWGSIRRSDLGKNYLKRVIGDDPSLLASRSPAQQAGSIRIPLLLAHGRLDPRVDVKHARLLEKTLRRQGLSPEYIEYRNAGHGLAIDEDRVDFYRRLLSFLQANIGS